MTTIRKPKKPQAPFQLPRIPQGAFIYERKPVPPDDDMWTAYS